jgi:hypothetical protein
MVVYVVSDCWSTPIERFFSYIMVRINNIHNDEYVCDVVLDQHAYIVWFLLYNVLVLSNTLSESRHVLHSDTLSRFQANQSLFLPLKGEMQRFWVFDFIARLDKDT